MKRFILSIIIISIFLTGCSYTNVDKTEKYQGGRLKVGIIGDVPKIRESQVEFENIDFDFLKDDDFDSEYDAIFITKDNLSEASNSEYTSIYKISKIPFYFIGNQKPHFNFIREDLSYEDAPDSKDGMYISGLLYTKDRFWDYGLYNDTESEKNIKGVYSRVFGDILEIKNNKLP